MKPVTCLVSSLLLSISLTPLSLQAVDYSQGSNIVKFQYKLASRGNAQAQYRLANMLEMGDGIDADLEQAKHWYDLASKAGLKAAQQRRTYLKVKQQGFDSATDTDWLQGVKADAGRHQADAVLLLGQLYRAGIGVKKDLNRSLGLFNEVRIRGEADVDKEIMSINEEISARARVPRNKQPPLPVQEKKVVPVSTSIHEAVRALKPETVDKGQAQAAVSQQQKLAEKMRRYEKAMRQLKQEQRLIDEQQADVTGDDDAVVDDEI